MAAWFVMECHTFRAKGVALLVAGAMRMLSGSWASGGSDQHGGAGRKRSARGRVSRSKACSAPACQMQTGGCVGLQ
ncbi:hypothetical protein BIFGAL_04027 [Bifidobacterium gallicum DSM 20093 = LMG 11596]|uniref:Uncharacterized protein n=1 Tax=Bifidobacterium gallicum DSM 20093 = LMG 11596 TaxID=561180 RepID=D1NVY3_9BIFI|nr:hypothetical protein BIFGAL_04027 [Bifidobacterium gallicum DSM 20093 = LMG 11596]